MPNGEGGSTVEEAFKEACASVWEHRHSDEYAAVKMQLYGLYKVAKEGKCQEPKPETILGGENARVKWDSWMRASTFSKEEAMAQYVSVALSVVKSRKEGVTNAAAAATAAAAKTGEGANLSPPSGTVMGDDVDKESRAPGSAAVSVSSGESLAEGTTSSASVRYVGEGDRGNQDDKSGQELGEKGVGQDEGGVGVGVRVGVRVSAAEVLQQREIERLKNHTRSLERYLGMVRDELSLATDGLEDVDLTVSGWLHRWRDRDVYLWGSPKWEPRFFALVGDTLTIFTSDLKAEVESVMSVKRCVLRDEGTKLGKSPGRGKPPPVYYVFGLYMEGALQRGPDSGVLLRLSTDSEHEADRWMSVLGEACLSEDEGEDDDKGEKIEAREEKYEQDARDDLVPHDTTEKAGELSRDIDGSFHGIGLSRNGSWDNAGGLNNLQQLKRLSRHLSLDRLDHEDHAATAVEAAAAAAATESAAADREERDKDKESHKSKRKRKFVPTGYPASRPMHKEAKVSLLSEEAPSQNYRGLLNLMAILLLVTNYRLIADNLRRHGVLVSFPKLTEPHDLYDAPRVTGTLLLGFHAAFTLGVEKLAMPRAGNEKGMLGGTEVPVLLLHGLNISLLLVIAMTIAWSSEGSPVFGFAYLFTAIILWLKLISYAHANRDLRLAWREVARAAKGRGGDDGEASKTGLVRGATAEAGGRDGVSRAQESSGDGFGGGGGRHQSDGLEATASFGRPKRNVSSSSLGSAVGQRRQRSFGSGAIEGGLGAVDETNSPRTPYPSNIGVLDLLYFWFAPTLCYQPDYPRSGKRRYKYIVSLIVRLVIVLGAMGVIADQYMLPTVHEFYDSVPSDKSLLVSLEHILTLAVPNTYFWLLGFYAFFHLMLNLLAEVLQFGDRMFYGDWWNANTIEAYWRLWNLPVHYWMVRHFYFPCLRAGVSKVVASTLCFLLSAVLHEVLVSVPFRMVKFYAFIGMFGNVPLVPLTKMLNKTLGDNQQVGNWIFWVLFCVVGQPMSLLLYYRDYCSEHECSNPLLD